MEDLKSAMMKALEERKAKGGISLEISIKPEEEKKKDMEKYGLAPEMKKDEGDEENESKKSEVEIEIEQEDEEPEMGSKMPDQLNEKDMAQIDESILGGEDPEEIVARLGQKPKLSVQEGMTLNLAKKKLKEKSTKLA